MAFRRINWRRVKRKLRVTLEVCIIVAIVCLGHKFWGTPRFDDYLLAVGAFLLVCWLVRAWHIWPFARGSIPKKTENAIWKRAKGRCEYRKWGLCRCHRTKWRYVLEVHHIWPVSKGGTSHFYNLALLCKEHNRKFSNKISWWIWLWLPL